MNARIKLTKQMLLRATVLVFALAIVAVPAMTVAAQTGGIGGKVVNPDPDNPRSQSIFIYTLKQGETKSDQILIMNRTDQEETVTLGSVDGVVTNTGDYTCRQEAEPVEDSGGWVKLEKNQLTLPAGGEEKVNFTVTVPEKADVGEHNSCLTVFQTDQEPADQDSGSSGVHLRMRQATRMIITIPGELRREISIEKFAVDNKRDQQNYALTVANKGNVSADVYMNVHLASLFNNRWFNVDSSDIGGEYPVVPDESLTKVFTTNKRPLFGGWYDATPSLRFDKRLGAFGTNSQKAEYETITGESVRMFFWPTDLGWLIIISVILLLLFIIWRITKRMSSDRSLRKKSKLYTVKRTDTVKSLAKKAKIDWEELVRLNNIEPPYTLETGQKILLPNVRTLSRRKKSSTSKKKAK